MDWVGIVGVVAASMGAAAAAWAANEARMVRLEIQKPNLLVYLEQNEENKTVGQLVVDNNGGGAAYKVRLIPKNADENVAWKRIEKTALYDEFGVSIIPPRSRFTVLLTNFHNLGEIPRNFTLTYYSGSQHNPSGFTKLSVTVRISDFDGRNYISSAERAMQRKVTDAMSKIASGRLEVTVKERQRINLSGYDE